jgi:cell division protein FtsQ
MGGRANRRKAARPSRRWPKLTINWRALLLPPMIAGCLTVAFVIGRDALDRPVGALIVEGTFERVSAVQVQAAGADLLRQGFLSLDLGDFGDRIAALDWVDTVRVTRVWPDTIRIRVTEHRAAATWGDNGLLNVRGELFTTRARHHYAELPQLSGPDGTEKEVARLYLAARGRLADSQLMLTALRMDARGAVQFELSGGQQIKLGREDVDARLQRFFSVVLPALATDFGRVDYVDLRYTNGFAIGWSSDAPPKLADLTEIRTRG